MPAAPDWLDEEARAEWDRVTPHLEAGDAVHEVDRALLAAYCSTYSLWAQLRRTVTAANVMTAGGKLSPQARYAESLLKQLRGLLDQLGFTPASRRQLLNGSKVMDLDEVLA